MCVEGIMFTSPLWNFPTTGISRGYDDYCADIFWISQLTVSFLCSKIWHCNFDCMSWPWLYCSWNHCSCTSMRGVTTSEESWRCNFHDFGNYLLLEIWGTATTAWVNPLFSQNLIMIYIIPSTYMYISFTWFSGNFWYGIIYLFF